MHFTDEVCEELGVQRTGVVLNLFRFSFEAIRKEQLPVSLKVHRPLKIFTRHIKGAGIAPKSKLKPACCQITLGRVPLNAFLIGVLKRGPLISVPLFFTTQTDHIPDFLTPYFSQDQAALESNQALVKFVYHVRVEYGRIGIDIVVDFPVRPEPERVKDVIQGFKILFPRILRPVRVKIIHIAVAGVILFAHMKRIHQAVGNSRNGKHTASGKSAFPLRFFNAPLYGVILLLSLLRVPEVLTWKLFVVIHCFTHLRE